MIHSKVFMVSLNGLFQAECLWKIKVGAGSRYNPDQVHTLILILIFILKSILTMSLKIKFDNAQGSDNDHGCLS